MSKEVFEEIKNVISVISILQLREKTFREELKFFNLKWKEVCRESAHTLYVGAFKRLEHEVGFLCVDTYSLFQGIEKKKSLYSKIIKQNGKSLSKTDKTPSNRDNCEFLGTLDSDGKIQPYTLEEQNNLINRYEEKAYESREALKQDFGIVSHKHEDLDEWISKILDDETLLQLKQYRKEFAHRLDSLDNLKRELDNRQPQDIEKMLDTISEALNSYCKCFQNLLGYTTSQHYLGITGLRYDSLSRLKLVEKVKISKVYYFEQEKAKDDENPIET